MGGEPAKHAEPAPANDLVAKLENMLNSSMGKSPQADESDSAPPSTQEDDAAEDLCLSSGDSNRLSQALFGSTHLHSQRAKSDKDLIERWAQGVAPLRAMREFGPSHVDGPLRACLDRSRAIIVHAGEKMIEPGKKNSSVYVMISGKAKLMLPRASMARARWSQQKKNIPADRLTICILSAELPGIDGTTAPFVTLKAGGVFRRTNTQHSDTAKPSWQSEVLEFWLPDGASTSGIEVAVMGERTYQQYGASDDLASQLEAQKPSSIGSVTLPIEELELIPNVVKTLTLRIDGAPNKSSIVPNTPAEKHKHRHKPGVKTIRLHVTLHPMSSSPTKLSAKSPSHKLKGVGPPAGITTIKSPRNLKAAADAYQPSVAVRVRGIGRAMNFAKDKAAAVQR